MTSQNQESPESAAVMVFALVAICLIMIPVGIVTIAYVLERLVTRRLHVKGPVERLIGRFSSAVEE